MTDRKKVLEEAMKNDMIGAEGLVKQKFNQREKIIFSLAWMAGLATDMPKEE